MDFSAIPDLSHYRSAWAADLAELHQNDYLNETSFTDFAHNRGVVSVKTIGISYLRTRGWLSSDAEYEPDIVQYHPFRVFPLKQTVRDCMNANPQADTLERLILDAPASIDQYAVAANRIAELAIMLEPLYWPRITGSILEHRCPRMAADDVDALWKTYRSNVLEMIGALDPLTWRDAHEEMRLAAAGMDRNSALYLLLRLTSWDCRKRLVGRISGALWIRHMAEVIRRAFEKVHGVLWEEEDRCFEIWPEGARTNSFGSERPLDDEMHSRPYLTWYHGLLTGSSARWYFEGPTEYYSVLEGFATLQGLDDPARAGVEVVNLHGTIQAGRDKAALKLEEWLIEDRNFRRFSLISFDRDVQENVKAILRQIKQGHIVGYIAAHEPDFEFANFEVSELAEIAALIDEKYGISGDLVRVADWSGVTNANAFEKLYCSVSSRGPRSLKGEEWGRALGAFAVNNQYIGNSRKERPFIQAIRAALQCGMAHYDFQSKYFSFDPETFRQVDLRELGDEPPSLSETRTVD